MNDSRLSVQMRRGTALRANEMPNKIEDIKGLLTNKTGNAKKNGHLLHTPNKIKMNGV